MSCNVTKWTILSRDVISVHHTEPPQEDGGGGPGVLQGEGRDDQVIAHNSHPSKPLFHPKIKLSRRIHTQFTPCPQPGLHCEAV